MYLESQETKTTPGHSSILFEHFLPVGFPLWLLEAIVPLLALSREKDMTVLLLRCEGVWGGNRGTGGKLQVTRQSLGVLDAILSQPSSTFCGKIS